MDQKNNCIISVACLLFRAGHRLRTGLKVWNKELGRETDDELKDIVNSIATACVEAKPLLIAAEVQSNENSKWDARLLRQLIDIAKNLGDKIVDPWEACSNRSDRKTLAARWKKANPTLGIRKNLIAWFNSLQKAWCSAVRTYYREFPPPPLSDNKVSFFVASSSEGASVALAFIKQLEMLKPKWKFTFWRDSKVFTPGRSTLEDLERIIGECDFGIYVMTPDDSLTIRKQRAITARGNVILELGMGIGLHCRERSFIVRDNVYKITDLSGITDLSYTAQQNPKSKRTGKAPIPDTTERKRIAEEIIEAVRKQIIEGEGRWFPSA